MRKYTARECIGFAAGELLDLLGDAHRAPIVTAHGAEVGVHVEILVVQGARRVRVECVFEVPLPVYPSHNGRPPGRDLMGASLASGTRSGDLPEARQRELYARGLVRSVVKIREVLACLEPR